MRLSTQGTVSGPLQTNTRRYGNRRASCVYVNAFSTSHAYAPMRYARSKEDWRNNAFFSIVRLTPGYACDPCPPAPPRSNSVGFSNLSASCS